MNDALERLAEVVRVHGVLSAEAYDSLRVDKPSRSTVRRVTGLSWRAAIKKAAEIIEGQRVRETITDLIAEMKVHAPRYEPICYQRHKTRVLHELCVFDLHLGKYAWAEETGDNYDLKIAAGRFRDAMDYLLTCPSFPPERYLFPIGNDYIHIDNPMNQTTRGTVVDTDGRFSKIFRTGFDLMVEAIEKMRIVAPVDIVVIPGNHETLTGFTLGVALSAWFHHCPEVNIDNSPKSRKYYRYGNNLIGFVHGGKDDPPLRDLPLVMAVEAADKWAKTAFREIHLGHLHHYRQMQLLGSSDKGVVMRYLPSVASLDAWHYRQGYLSHKVASLLLWDHSGGCIGEINRISEK